MECFMQEAMIMLRPRARKEAWNVVAAAVVMSRFFMITVSMTWMTPLMALTSGRVILALIPSQTR